MSLERLIKGILDLPIVPNTDAPKLSKYSFKGFMGVPLEHYQCIRGGIFFEDVLKGMVRLSPDCQLINKKFVGHKQIDLFYANKKEQCVHYDEVKCNIDNDTEKMWATSEKISLVNEHLKSRTEYANYKLACGVLCPTNLCDENVTYGKERINVYSLQYFLNTIGQTSSNEETAKVADAIRKLYLKK